VSEKLATQPVQRFGSVIRLRAGEEAKYRALHADVWPEVLATIHEVNIRNYSIFLFGGLLFSYFEYVGSDFAADMARMADDPATQRWWQLTDPCQQPMDGAAGGQWWTSMAEVFHSD
jgi:L-rhamnose mutarotase